MVVEDMRNTGVLGNPEEYFIPWNAGKSDIDWLKNLDQIVKKASSENGVVAIKVMANQLHHIEECLKVAGGSSFDDVGENGIFPRFREVTKNAHYIYIRRDNILRQAISRSMSRQTGINHAVGKKDDTHFAGNLLKGYTDQYNKNVVYKQEEIEGEMFNITNENILWEGFFNVWGIANPLSLRYEEVCKNSPGYLNRIAKYVSQEIDISNHSRKMVRLANQKNEDWYSTYFEKIINSRL